MSERVVEIIGEVALSGVLKRSDRVELLEFNT